MNKTNKRIVTSLVFLMPGLSAFASGGSSHGDPFAMVFEAFAIILICALLGRFVANKFKQSTVLGELVMGILLGVILTSLDRPVMHFLRNPEVIQQAISHIEKENAPLLTAIDQALSSSSLPDNEQQALRAVVTSGDATPYINLVRYVQLFSTIGISVLLFMVGLEDSIMGLVSVGAKDLLIALLGTGVSFGLGYITLQIILSASEDSRLAFFGAATICCTSAGITARVLKDLNKLNTQEAKMTMGAAVFDDILGLVLLAVLTNVMVGGEADSGTVVWIVVKIVLFLAAVVFFGLKILPRVIPAIEKLDPPNIKLLFPFILMLLLSFLANAIGLAMIIGAYFAGLMITENLFTTTPVENRSTVESLIAPLEGIFVPVFFVLMGLQVDVTLFADLSVILTGIALSAVAILGKLGAGIFLPANFKKTAVGWGMVPRGEVVLIFANIGKSMGIISPQFYASTVMVILITVLIAPPALTSVYKNVNA